MDGNLIEHQDDYEENNITVEVPLEPLFCALDIFATLFWESGDEIEKDDFREYFFCSYEKLANTFETGISRELGAFLRKS